MSKCVLCGRELLTGDVHWEQGLCNECYNKTKNSDPYFDVVVDKRKIQIREKYIEDLEKQLAEKDKEIETLKDDCKWYQDEYYMIQDKKEHFAGQCYNLQDEIKRLLKNAKLRKKAYNSKYKQFQEKCKKQIRKQVCDEIKGKAEPTFSYNQADGQIGWHISVKDLDQIEKGE